MSPYNNTWQKSTDFAPVECIRIYGRITIQSDDSEKKKVKKKVPLP
jgi:hypothetical protein